MKVVSILSSILIVVLFLLSLVHSKNAGYKIVNVVETKNSLPSNAAWWIELGENVLYYVSEGIEVNGLVFQDISPSNLFVIQRIHKFQVEKLNAFGTILLNDWGFAVFAPNRSDEWAQSVVNSRSRWWKFDQKNTVLVSLVKNSTNENVFNPNGEKGLAPPVSDVVSLINITKWFADVTQLASYNRYTLGTGIANAEKWIITELDALPNINVTTQAFTVSGRTAYNIIGTLPGTTYPNEWVIIGAHYDSTSQSPTTSAPGAEDNGSGSAGLLQIARALSQFSSPRTAIFIFFSGEEQGLVGSKFNAQQIVNNGDKAKVILMHNMDMIGYQAPGNPLKVLLETTPTFSSLFTPYTNAQRSFAPALQIATSTTAWGSDHEPYLNLGIPALLTIDYDWDIYPYYHRTTDLPQYLSPAIAENILKMGLGTVAATLGFE